MHLEIAMPAPDLLDPVSNDQEAEMAKAAQRCLMAAFDHSHAPRIALVNEGGRLMQDAPVLELPPRALHFFADMLGLMAQRCSIMLVPQTHELTTQEAAGFLNVSRPVVIKEIGAGRLSCRKAGRDFRIEFDELRRYQREQRKQSERALRELAEVSQNLDLGY
jgi:excisionase family DNA binding protein